MQVTWTTKEELIEKLRNLSYKELYKRVRTRARKRKIDVPTTKGELVHLLAELMQGNTPHSLIAIMYTIQQNDMTLY